MQIMQGRALRNTVRAIALLIAITTAIAVPAGYFVVGYSNTAEVLGFKARLNAARVAQYIYAHNVMWQYQELRLSELIQLPEGGEQPIRQKVFDQNEKLVLDEGPDLAAPIMTRRVPIVVSDAAVGSLVAEASLRDTVFQTGFVALLSALLGFAIYLAVRALPMRVLDRTLSALNATQRTLVTQNERFDAALTNMSQGLCLFDADGKLVIFNPRFAEIYGLPPAKILPGMSTRWRFSKTSSAKQSRAHWSSISTTVAALRSRINRWRTVALSRPSRTLRNGCKPRKRYDIWRITTR